MCLLTGRAAITYGAQAQHATAYDDAELERIQKSSWSG
jgi:hypothetical protein